MLRLANGLIPLGHFNLLRNIDLNKAHHSNGGAVKLLTRFECLADSFEMPSRARFAGAQANN